MTGIPTTLARHRLRTARRRLAEGGVIAYPTEAVYGLGCDPDDFDAVRTVLRLKARAASKGLILIAADLSQLLPYIDLSAVPHRNRVLKTWPGPITWLIKARPSVPVWLRGKHESIAVRVTAHPIAAELCRAYGKALVSTSANPAGARPAGSALKTRLYFPEEDILILKGPVGASRKPTAIFDARTLRRLR